MKKVILSTIAVCFMLGGGFVLPNEAQATETSAPTTILAAQSYQSRMTYSWGTATTYKRSQVSSLLSVIRELDKGISISQGINVIAGFTPSEFYLTKDSSYYAQMIEAIKYQNNKTMRGVVLNLTYDGGFWVSNPPK